MPATSPDVLGIQGRKLNSEHESITESMAAEERIRKLYRRGKEKVVQAEERFESNVGAHPVKTVLIATGVGLAIGFLLGRRR